MYANDDLKTRLEFQLVVVVEPDEAEFHAFCPALKGLHTAGSTEEEALQNARDAAAAYILSLIKHGDPIPLGVMDSKSEEGTSRGGRQGVREFTERIALQMA
jgi:predicted RNase H-like HicB family nuclease